MRIIALLSVVISYAAGWSYSASPVFSKSPAHSPSSASAIAISTVPFTIVYPYEKKVYANLPYSFIYGSADPRGTLTLNGCPVPIYQSGGFLAMLPLSTGTFTITAQLSLPSTSYTLTRTVFVTPPAQPVPAVPVTILSSQPNVDISLPAGEEFFVECRGSAGSEASFKIKGVQGKFPMIETPARSGSYRGIYKIRDTDKFENAGVEITLENKKEHSKAKVTAPGKVSRAGLGLPWAVDVTTDIASVRAGYALTFDDKAGYVLFPAIGTRLWVTGKRGAELKVRLGKNREGWISDTDVKRVDGVLPQRIISDNIAVLYNAPLTSVRISMNGRAPYDIVPSLDRRTIDISFFGVTANTDWIRYGSSETIVSQIEWFQDEPETMRVRLHLRDRNWWGYDARYENGNYIFELRKPVMPAESARALEGITVAVDAGHSPDTGAIGPTGVKEKDVNRDIAVILEKKLIKAGAKVVMLRNGDDAVGLYERPRRARQARADVLMSIHSNALPDSGNPFEKNGYGVYYFNPYSLSLAQEISDSFTGAFGDETSENYLRDDGVYYANFALPRITQMPAVLIECAYMIVPREEALLSSEQFQKKCAQAILTGLKKYAASMRAK